MIFICQSYEIILILRDNGDLNHQLLSLFPKYIPERGNDFLPVSIKNVGENCHP